MNYKVFKESIVGYKNVIKGKESQDYIDYKYIDGGIIGALADGHSTEYFKYSDVGAKLACQCAINVLEEFSKDIIVLKNNLESGTIQKEIANRWWNLVDKHYKSINPIVYKTEYLKYSTTLISALITSEYKLYLKIGDGCIVERNNKEYESILISENQYIVDSLGRKNSYEYIKYDLRLRNEEETYEKWVILFTDGYENAFLTDKELFKSLDITISRYNKSIFSKFNLNNTYTKYLNKLSKDKTHDDITIMFIELK